MLNIDEFTSRLEELFKKYDLTPSTFADKIGVQRSSISHLLSGRNKPSLDFVLKVQDVFPDVELDWLLHGKGNFDATASKSALTSSHSKNLFDQNEPVDLKQKTSEDDFNKSKSNKEYKVENTNPADLFAASFDTSSVSSGNGTLDDATGNQIDKIVIFYKNGTFKSFKPD